MLPQLGDRGGFVLLVESKVAMRVLSVDGGIVKNTDRCKAGSVGKYHLECKARSARNCELIGIETVFILACLRQDNDSYYSQLIDLIGQLSFRFTIGAGRDSGPVFERPSECSGFGKAE